MNIAIATRHFETVSGQVREWLVYDSYIRLMAEWGAPILLTRETVLRTLPDMRFDRTTLLCKLRDIFSRH